MTELDKLEELLKEKGYPYIRVEDPFVYNGRDIGTHRIDVFESEEHKSKYNRIFDAICQDGSIGYESGLLEVFGEPVIPNSSGDAVCGNMTAKEVMQLYEEYKFRIAREPDNWCIHVSFIDGSEDLKKGNLTIMQVSNTILELSKKYVLIPEDLDMYGLYLKFRGYFRKESLKHD